MEETEEREEREECKGMGGTAWRNGRNRYSQCFPYLTYESLIFSVCTYLCCLQHTVRTVRMEPFRCLDFRCVRLTLFLVPSVTMAHAVFSFAFFDVDLYIPGYVPYSPVIFPFCSIVFHSLSNLFITIRSSSVDKLPSVSLLSTTLTVSLPFFGDSFPLL